MADPHPLRLLLRSSSLGRASFRPQVEILEERCLLAILADYYSYDGTGNNLANPLWGSTDVELLRYAGTAYQDGVSAMRNGPNARSISNIIGTQIDQNTNDRNMSDMIYAWGQFIDHDLDLTPEGTLEYAPIPVPAGDPTFDPTNTGTAEIDFFRDVFTPGTGTSTSNPRENPNEDTAYLDGSVVYGNNATTAAALRTFVGGQLKTSYGDLLPFDTQNIPIENDTMQLPNTQLFLGGDIRANENGELTTMDVLFVREHNYWAGQLAAENPTWTDEQLYQGARQIVIAEIQAITFNEFLPALLGPNVITPYTGYDPNVNPGITAEFSTAAFRVGHSLVNDNIDFFNNDGSESHDPLDFNLSADNPAALLEPGATVDNILKYLTADNAQEVDPQIVDALRNQLFAPPDPSLGGSDLFAIDIQRGRDLGLPDYNTERAAYGLAPVTSFDQISSDPTVQDELRQIYGTNALGQDNVSSIDLFVGGLAEDRMPGGSVGPLFTTIIADQFENIRDGDRLWYQNIFSGADLNMIQNTTLVDVIKRNTIMTNLQDNVFFFTTGTISGHVTQNGTTSGLGGVTVQLLDSSGDFLTQTTTAADGTYSFDTASLDPTDVGTNPVTFQVRIVAPSASYRLTSAAVQTVNLAANSGAGEFDVNFTFSYEYLVTGTEAGVVAEVKVYDAATQALKFDLKPFGNFTGGVRVAVGDVNGDGIPDIIAGAGPGGGPQVNVYDGVTGQLIRSFDGLAASFTGGVYVAAGDTDADGFADIIVGAGAGGGPQVTVWSGKDGSLLQNFYAMASSFSGGVRVAAGDVNGDGFADIITAAGPGGGPQVAVFSGRDGSLLRSFYGLAPDFTGGVFVAAGDIEQDGMADVIVGAGAGGGPQVTLFRVRDLAILGSFFASSPNFTGGVRVGSDDVNGDGRPDILSGAGPGGAPQLVAFDSQTLMLLTSFYVNSSQYTNGIFVA